MRQMILSIVGFVAVVPNFVSAQQVVQLPTLGTFSVNTSVLVPDTGSTSLGSIRSSANGSNQRGSFPGSARGSRSIAGGVSVHATIIDLQEMDREILQLAANQKNPTVAELHLDRLTKSKLVGLSQADLDDVRFYLIKAQEARRHGRLESADVYLKLAESKIPTGKQAKSVAPFAVRK